MASTFRTWAITSLLLAFTPVTQAAIEKYTVIDGVSRALVLEPNTRLQVEGDTATHYRGHLKELPDSWVRVSHIGDSWDGLISHQGQLYAVKELADASAGRARSSQPQAEALQGLDSLGSCVGEFQPTALPGTPAKTVHSKALTPGNAFTNAAATIEYPTDCSETIDGICLVAELTVFFDSQFRNAYPSDYRSRGAEILNIVDGIYQNDLGIAFNVLRLDFSNGDQFTSDNNPIDILEDMVNKRFQTDILPEDPNIYSMMHLITGRDFLFDDGTTVDTSVVGLARGTVYDVGSSPLAFSSALCLDYGGTVGTSQLIRVSGQPSAALTAVVVAHELGHNLGMEHDSDPESATAASCTDADRIMYPSVVPGASQFSACSHEAASLNISSLPAVEACFDFPVEASLTADSGNTTQTGANSPAQHQFSVGLETANGYSGALQVTGSITSGDGVIDSVILGVTPCTVNAGQDSYNCTANSPAALSDLSVSFTTGSEDLELEHEVTAGQDLFDIDDSNNARTATVQVQGAGLPPTSLTLDYNRSRGTVVLNWQDHATDELNYQVERSANGGGWQVLVGDLAANTEQYVDQDPAPGTRSYRVAAILGTGLTAPSNTVTVDILSNRLQDHASPGGGGGGSLSWLSLGSLLLLLVRRIRKHQLNKSCSN